MTDAARPPGAFKTGTYYCFDEWDEVAEARSRFVELFAHEPAFTWIEARMLWMGPIGKGDENDRGNLHPHAVRGDGRIGNMGRGAAQRGEIRDD